jgi:hypothetical protein
MILPVQKAFKRAASRFLAALSILLGLGGCMLRPVSEKELIGTYQAVPMEILNVQATGLPDGGVEILELKPDGTCEQDIALKDGRKFSAKGTWEYYPPPHAHIIMQGTYVAVHMGQNIAANIEKTITTVRDFPIGRDLAGRIILGSTEYTHYEKK